MDNPPHSLDAPMANLEDAILERMDAQWRSLASLGFDFNTQWLVAPARRLIRAGLVQRKTGPGYLSLYRRIG